MLLLSLESVTSANCAPPPGLIEKIMLPSSWISGVDSLVPGDSCNHFVISSSDEENVIWNSRVNIVPVTSTVRFFVVDGNGTSRAHSHVALIAEARVRGLFPDRTNQPTTPISSKIAIAIRMTVGRRIFLPNASDQATASARRC